MKDNISNKKDFIEILLNQLYSLDNKLGQEYQLISNELARLQTEEQKIRQVIQSNNGENNDSISV